MDDLQIACALSELSFAEESMRYRDYPIEDRELKAAIQASMNSYDEEIAVQMLIEKTKLDAIPEPKAQNDCLDVAFKSIYRYRYGSEYVGNLRDAIRKIVRNRLGHAIDPELYEIADGQQLSLHVFEMILAQYDLRVAYIRPMHPLIYIGSPIHYPIQGLAIQHTVNADYGGQGESRYAGHYEVVQI